MLVWLDSPTWIVLLRTLRAVEDPTIDPLVQRERPRQALALEVNDDAVGADLSEFNRSGIDPPDVATIAADGALILQIRLPVVPNPLCRDGQAGLIDRLALELPGEHDLASFEHQVPMLAVGEFVV